MVLEQNENSALILSQTFEWENVYCIFRLLFFNLFRSSVRFLCLQEFEKKFLMCFVLFLNSLKKCVLNADVKRCSDAAAVFVKSPKPNFSSLTHAFVSALIPQINRPTGGNVNKPVFRNMLNKWLLQTSITIRFNFCFQLDFFITSPKLLNNARTYKHTT